MAECGFNVSSAQLPGLASSSVMKGSFQSVAVAKSPPSAFSLGLLNIGATHCPLILAMIGRSLLINSASVDASSSAAKIHSDQ